MEGQDQNQAPSSSVSPAQSVGAAPQPASSPVSETASASRQTPAQSPAAQSSSAQAPSPRKNNLRHILAIIILSILGLGVAGAIIYFTLHATGVITTITENSNNSNSKENGSTSDSATERAKLVSRIDLLRDGTVDSDPTLEQDIKNYIGKIINEQGKDSSAAYDGIMILISYYNANNMYDEAKSYLEDRISVSDNDDNTNAYKAEIYRLATEHGDEATANAYLDEVNNDANAETKSAKLRALSLQIMLDLLNERNQHASEDGHSHADDQEQIELMRKFAEEAEALHPTGDTAYVLSLIEVSFGDPAKAEAYQKLAAERDPEHFKGVTSDTEL